MEKIENADYLVQFPKGIERVVKNGVDYATKKKREYCKVFGCKRSDISQIKATIFTNKEDFVNYIKKISNGQQPPEWATGCFYGGEIQVFVDEKDVVELNRRMGTIAHETVHLMFNKLIYDKFKIQRVTWLDESFANYLDGIVLAWLGDSWEKIAERLLPYKNFDVNKFNNRSKIKTHEYDGYDMFHIIGKYIFENNLQKQFLEKLKTDRKEIVQLGKTILATAIDWFVEQNTMQKYEIRKAVEADADAILDVNLNCWQTTYGAFFKKEVFENRRATRDKKIAWWKQHLAGEHNAYVAVAGGKIVGYMDYFDISRTHPGYAEIGSIYILKDYQKMGIGTKFFEIAFQLAKNKKKHKMMLNVLDKNSALEFYKKMGGKVIGDVEIEKAGEKFKEDIVEFKI